MTRGAWLALLAALLGGGFLATQVGGDSEQACNHYRIVNHHRVPCSSTTATTTATNPAPPSGTLPVGCTTNCPVPTHCTYGPNGTRDLGCTPGALNPAVTPSTIKQTICVVGWTSTVRPPLSYTAPLKLKLMSAYGVGGQSTSGFELDHQIALEVGGAPSDPRNLWPQPWPQAGVKDSLENQLRTEICSGKISLAAAQAQLSSSDAPR